jgi:hypothetical protein
MRNIIVERKLDVVNNQVFSIHNISPAVCSVGNKKLNQNEFNYNQSDVKKLNYNYLLPEQILSINRI